MSQSADYTREEAVKPRAKRTAHEAGMYEQQHSPPTKKRSSLLPGEEPTGHYCSVCEDMIHVSECVKLFIGCGHMFHHRCSCHCEMNVQCPVCHLKVSDANPARTIMFRVAKVLSAMTTPQRLEMLNKAHREKATLAKMTLARFYETVNTMVYHNQLPREIDVTVSVGRFMVDDFVIVPNNGSQRVYIYLREKHTHIQNQWELYRVMWCLYMRTHNIRDVDQMFMNMTIFEDFYG